MPLTILSLLTYRSYSIPSIESLRDLIREDDFDLEMAKTEDDRKLATNARSSKIWRALRIASKSKLKHFDRIENGNNLQALFEDDRGDGQEEANETTTPLPLGVAVK